MHVTSTRILLLVLSAATLTAGAVAQERGPGRRGEMRRPPDPILTALDVDGDGELSAEELAGAAAALVGLDRDGDGNLAQSELAPPGRGGRRGRPGGGPGGPGGPRGPGGRSGGAGPLLAALDLDRDAALFEDEVTDAARALAKLDLDGDGRLAGDELLAGGGAAFGRGGFPGGPPGGFGRQGNDGGPGRTLAPDELEFEDGVATIADRETFERLSYQGAEVMRDVGLKGLEFVKFTITGADTDAPLLYFINTETHRAHPAFAGAVGIAGGRGGGRGGGGGMMRGVLSYRPMSATPSGQPGLYTFEFNPGDSYSHAEIRSTFDLLVERAPILAGRLAFYPLPAMQQRVDAERDLYAEGGVPLFSPDGALDDVAFLPLHSGVGFGRLRILNPGERPGARDVVLCSVLPKEMPRVAGILSGARQTPLSHVNLRAIQDDVPNAYVRGAAGMPDVAGLVGEYVRYEVTASGFELREASLAEVDAHFAELRPADVQVPPLDLSVTALRSLDALGFGDAASVGVKAANLAALRKLGLPEGAVPAGFAVPFSFYDAFMRHNGLDVKAQELLADPRVREDAGARRSALKKLRSAIKKGEMPAPLRDALGAVQAAFQGSSIRCRSSTNNEDLPGFSGAGLYDSFTHHAQEGHLEKSIRQVYASLWNLRAFEEREFHRVDHMATAMGVLLHVNAKGELANGVAVTEDVVYQTAQQGPLLYYVNAQLGESLVTNPDPNAVPEELLLAPRNPASDRLVQTSNLIDADGRILTDEQRLALRRALRKVHAGFAELYAVPPDAPFAMEVEFKVLADGRLSVKQARPWVR